MKSRPAFLSIALLSISSFITFAKTAGHNSETTLFQESLLFKFADRGLGKDVVKLLKTSDYDTQEKFRTLVKIGLIRRHPEIEAALKGGTPLKPIQEEITLAKKRLETGGPIEKLGCICFYVSALTAYEVAFYTQIANHPNNNEKTTEELAIEYEKTVKAFAQHGFSKDDCISEDCASVFEKL